jgi:hypothetical protein
VKNGLVGAHASIVLWLSRPLSVDDIRKAKRQEALTSKQQNHEPVAAVEEKRNDAIDKPAPFASAVEIDVSAVVKSASDKASDQIQLTPLQSPVSLTKNTLPVKAEVPVAALVELDPPGEASKSQKKKRVTWAPDGKLCSVRVIEARKSSQEQVSIDALALCDTIAHQLCRSISPVTFATHHSLLG